MTTATTTLTVIPGPRPCLVCEVPCSTEGQLCRACCDAGHYVTDAEVVFHLEVRVPESLRP